MFSRQQYLSTTAVFTAAILSSVTATGEVTIDGSLGGNAGSQVTPGMGFTYDIRPFYGRTEGANLFHSFDQFNINPGDHANFSGMPNIVNIIARVTGGESTIAGRITSTINNSSLFLVNPAGFIISNGAVVDVDGSFFLSTADFLSFSDKTHFFSQLSPVSTLSSAPVADFGLLAGGSGRVTIDSSRAIPGEDQSIGQNLNVNSNFISIEDSDIIANEIIIRMGDAAFGEILINNTILASVEGGVFFQGGNILAVKSLITASGKDSLVEVRASAIALEDQSTIQSGNLQASGGGIDIVAQNISLSQNSALVSISGGNIQGGDIDLSASDIVVEENSHINLSAGPGSTAGNLTIRADNILIQNNSDLNTSSRFLGATAGNIDIQVNHLFGLTDNSVLLAESDSNGIGGTIEVIAKKILVSEHSKISINALGNGNSNLIDLVAGEALVLDQNSVISAVSTGQGNAGTVQLRGELVLLNSAIINGTSNGEGRGGVVAIEASDNITIQNTELSSKSEGGGIGGDIGLKTQNLMISGLSILNVSGTGAADAGDISIDADTVSLSDRSRIFTTAAGSGNAGKRIAKTSSFTLSGDSEIQASVSVDGVGNLVQINTTDISLSGNSRISSNTAGTDVGGVIEIRADTLTLSGKAKLSTNTFGSGEGGTIDIRAKNVSLLEQSSLEAATAQGTGNAGIISISGLTEGSRSESLAIDGGKIITNTDVAGIGGGVLINADQVQVVNGGAIRSDSLASGDGGGFIINASELRLDNADLTAVVRSSGHGGEINLDVDILNLQNSASLIVSSITGSGDAGIINILSKDIHVTDSDIALATETDGDAGILNITTEVLAISNSIIAGRTSGAGRGADITINATATNIGNNSRLDSTAINSGNGGVIVIDGATLTLNDALISAETSGEANGGGIILNVGETSLTGNSKLNVKSGKPQDSGSAILPGEAGDILVNANSYTMDGGLILFITETEGAGGALTINADDILLSNKAVITASAIGNGDAGSVALQGRESSGTNSIASNSIRLNSESKINSDTTGAGIGGDILINTNQLVLIEKSLISSSATGIADGGSVSIFAIDRLEIVNGTIQTISEKSGGGNITIKTEDVIRIDNSTVSASANGVRTDSAGGNVSIDPRLFTVRQSQIVAQANVGNGGNINLSAINFIVDTESLISASSQKDIDGSVDIESPNQAVNPVNMDLNTGFQDLPDFISNNCSELTEEDRSYLIVENLNAVKRDPNDYLQIYRNRQGPVAQVARSTSNARYMNPSSLRGC
jgi:filamentous hemagglutinin family protein